MLALLASICTHETTVQRDVMKDQFLFDFSMKVVMGKIDAWKRRISYLVEYISGIQSRIRRDLHYR